MASLKYQCSKCRMALNDSHIERHISAQHLAYFPLECTWCKEDDQKHFSASKEDMKQHTWTSHNGKNSRYLASEDNAKEAELKKLAKECRRSAISQIPPNDSKSDMRRILNVLDGASTIANAAEDDLGLAQVKREKDEDVIIVEDDDEIAAMPNNSAGGNVLKEEGSPEIIRSLIPPGSTTEHTVSVATKQSNIIDPITNFKNNATSNAVPMTKSEPLENVSTVPEELRLQAPLCLFPPIDTDTNEDQHNSVAKNAIREPSNNRRKQDDFGNTSRNSVGSRKKRKVPLEASARYSQSPSDSTCEPHSIGRKSDEGQTITNGNGHDRPQNRTTSVVLDIPYAQKIKIRTIWIDICHGTVSFETSERPKYHCNRHLSVYASLLRESEADVRGCKANIDFYQSSGSANIITHRGIFQQFAKEVKKIARLWANGDVEAVLHKYSEHNNKAFPLSDLCDDVFSQDRSILACKKLKIQLDNSWPLSVVTNVAHRCNQLTVKDTATCYQEHRLHYSFWNIIHKIERPRRIEIALEIDFPKSAIDFIDELKERFGRSTDDRQYFKFTLISPCKIQDELLRNKCDTLEMKTEHSHSRRHRVIIEQRCCVSDSMTKSLVGY